jgi:Protein of unknown function (DUF4235)
MERPGWTCGECRDGVAFAGMKLLYKPLGFVAAVISAKLGDNTFRRLWTLIDGGELPAAGHKDDSLGRVVLARSLEAATVTAVAVSVERLTMRWFQFLVGVWPGRTPEDNAESPVADAAADVAKAELA